MVILRLPPLPTVRDILKLYRLSAIKQLSQNFLLDERLTDKIAKCIGEISGSKVLEVGPGPGTITRSIMKKLPEKLIVVEKDIRFKPTLNMLRDAFAVTDHSMDIIFQDILSIDMTKLFANGENRSWNDECPNMYLVGNLPFSVSTSLIINWLHDISEKQGAWMNGRVQMLLTFQKEVAERLVAEVSDGQRCRLSIMAQAWTIPKLRFTIPGSAFVPKPNIDVGVVSFTPLKKPRTNHKFKIFEKVNRHLYSFRQKFCIKSAGTLFPPDCREELSKMMFKLAYVNPELRAFNLTVEEVSRLTSAYKFLSETHPEILDYNYRASRKVLSKNLIKSVSVQNYQNSFDTYRL